MFLPLLHFCNFNRVVVICFIHGTVNHRKLKGNSYFLLWFVCFFFKSGKSRIAHDFVTQGTFHINFDPGKQGTKLNRMAHKA